MGRKRKRNQIDGEKKEEESRLMNQTIRRKGKEKLKNLFQGTVSRDEHFLKYFQSDQNFLNDCRWFLNFCDDL
jgi:hypothetical protein